eukprot:CAMPEP_0182435016 /NCGR_PEP_ID=MMETSP1167-20130531/73090_1 /TAXON_ID=2988 /ORGANISM="Mallomonas Sp, Strain CCMP3275" /LENGTH=267 /DNA_ID=CAMNT_0024625537 /DNA_START=42 /DNA_END=845 /DNA_ORIENTATION=+
MTGSEMRAVYNNSLFVIIGRGWNSLDCFRVYEAIISGALPVVVGDLEEIKAVFFFNNHPPPLVMAQNWSAAVLKCASMSSHDIDSTRIELVRWYVSRMAHVRTNLAHVFNLTLPDDFTINPTSLQLSLDDSAREIHPLLLSGREADPDFDPDWEDRERAWWAYWAWRKRRKRGKPKKGVLSLRVNSTYQSSHRNRSMIRGKVQLVPLKSIRAMEDEEEEAKKLLEDERALEKKKMPQSYSMKRVNNGELFAAAMRAMQSNKKQRVAM